jgi:hypothetical protein
MVRINQESLHAAVGTLRAQREVVDVTGSMHRVLMIDGYSGMREAMRALLTAADYRFVGAETAARRARD